MERNKDHHVNRGEEQEAKEGSVGGPGSEVVRWCPGGIVVTPPRQRGGERELHGDIFRLICYFVQFWLIKHCLFSSFLSLSLS